MIQVLKNRQFFALWLANFVSTFGDWLAILALFSLVTFRLHGTASQVSGMMISFVIPAALVGPVAGVFVDRWNVKRTMIASDLIRAVVTALLALAHEMPHIYALVFTLSAVSCFFTPAQNVAIRLIVREEELLAANALNTQVTHLNKVVGPAMAGVLVAWAGENVCFAIDSVTFLLSAAMLSVLTLRREAAGTGKGISSVRKEFWEGIRYVLEHRAIRFVVFAMGIAILALGAFDALISIYVRDVLHSKSQLFGALVSAIGVGTIVGALLIVKFAGRFGQGIRKVYLVVLGIFGLGAFILLITAAGNVPVTLFGCLLAGLGVACVLIPSQTLFQEETPPSLLGRVSSTTTSLLTVSQAVAFALAGTLADWIGIRRLYYLLGLMLILTAVLGFGYAKTCLMREKPKPPVYAS